MFNLFKVFSEKNIDDVFEFYKKYVVWTLIFLHIVYFTVLMKISVFDSKYINFLRTFVNVFICLFLMYRFHPFRKEVFIKKYDDVIIFTCAVVLFMNEGFVNYILAFVKGSGKP